MGMLATIQLAHPTDSAPIRSFAGANQELVAGFIRWMTARGLSKHTIREYIRSAEWYTEYLKSTSVTAATRADILGYLQLIADRGVSGCRLHVDTAGLRSFFKFLQYADVISIDPMLQIAHRKLPHRVPRVLSVEEINKLVAAARNPFERAIVEVFYSTGVRISELVNIRLENINLSGRTILIKHGKGGKDRYVLFGEQAASAITDYQRWRPSQEFLFEAPAHPARPYQCRSIYRALRKIAYRAGVKGVHPHALRRATACHMLKSGADLRSIQELLGHSNLTTTQLYTYLEPNDLKRIHDSCHPHGGDSK
jgi:site-specific recombinase XerD